MTMREFVTKKKIVAATADKRTSKQGNEVATIKCFLAKGGKTIYIDCCNSNAIPAFDNAGWSVVKLLDSIFVESKTGKDGTESFFGEVVEMLG